MTRIFGDVMAGLANTLNVEGGRVRVTQLRDDEGVSLVYDVGGIVQGELLAAAGRTENAVLGGVLSTIQLGNLPATAQVVGAEVTVSSTAALTEVSLIANQWGTIAGGANNPDLLLWHWRAGGTSISRPQGLTQGGAEQATYLIPSIQRMPYLHRNTQRQEGRQAVFDLSWNALTSGAAATLTASIYFYFFRPPEPVPGFGSLTLNPPSW